MFLKSSIKLNLGCGEDVRKGWNNYDISPSRPEVLPLDLRDTKAVLNLGAEKPDVIELNHVIGYFHFADAKILLNAIYDVLNPGGTLIIEYPDALKVAKNMINSEGKEEYLEAMRAMFAFDLFHIEQPGFDIKTYVFGWNHMLLTDLLSSTGFSNIRVKKPKTHGKRYTRDVRIECKKNNNL